MSYSINRLKGVMKLFISLEKDLTLPTLLLGTAVAQSLRCCATNRKVAGSIPAGVIGIFH